MSWSIGYDDKWKRDIGYGVPAYCDHPECWAEINRGISYVCGEQPYGGDRGCGLYFCERHLNSHERLPRLCERCSPRIRKPFGPTIEHPEWIDHKMTDPSWQEWRDENPGYVRRLEHDIGNLRKSLDSLKDYLAHDSWRCKHYDKCHCGLDEVTDSTGLERVPR